MENKEKSVSFEIEDVLRKGRNQDTQSYFKKVLDILDRTHIAMGKKKEVKYSVSATTTQKINTTLHASTYKDNAAVE